MLRGGRWDGRIGYGRGKTVGTCPHIYDWCTRGNARRSGGQHEILALAGLVRGDIQTEIIIHFMDGLGSGGGTIVAVVCHRDSIGSFCQPAKRIARRGHAVTEHVRILATHWPVNRNAAIRAVARTVHIVHHSKCEIAGNFLNGNRILYCLCTMRDIISEYKGVSAPTDNR